MLRSAERPGYGQDPGRREKFPMPPWCGRLRAMSARRASEWPALRSRKNGLYFNLVTHGQRMPAMMLTHSAGLRPSQRQEVPPHLAALREQYQRVRAETEALCAPLYEEDYGVQGAGFVSPPKWHLAHTSWFFERFLLEPALLDYRPFDPHYAYMFNSYYEQMGGFHPRDQRGILSRPTLAEIRQYRSHVDDAMSALFVQCLAEDDPEIAARIELGLHHEQQHQELLLMDIKYNFALNPLRPSYHEASSANAETAEALRWLDYEGGLTSFGHLGKGFAFDNETPRHSVFLRPFRLASRLVTNGEYMEFIKSGGYERPQYWLSDGWQGVREHRWGAPLYWERMDGRWWQMDLSGMRPVEENEPVCHVRLSGSARRVMSPSSAISWRRASIGPTSRAATLAALRKCSAMHGSGRVAPTRPIPVIAPPPARSANTTASSCATKWCCAAARA